MTCTEPCPRPQPPPVNSNLRTAGGVNPAGYPSEPGTASTWASAAVPGIKRKVEGAGAADQTVTSTSGPFSASDSSRAVSGELTEKVATTIFPGSGRDGHGLAKAHRLRPVTVVGPHRPGPGTRASSSQWSTVPTWR